MALVTVLIVSVIAITLALASSMLVMGNALVQTASERAGVLDDAALSGLEEARNRLNARTDTVPLTGFITLENGVVVSTVGNVRRWTWAGRIGNADSLANAGEYGVQSEIVSRVTDASGQAAVRRSLVYQNSFARYAYFTDIGKTPSGGTLWFRNGWTASGPLHSNDSLYIENGTFPEAIFKDVVTTARGVFGANMAQWDKGPARRISPIPMPGTADLNILRDIANRAGYVFTPTVITGDSALVTMRIEFLAIDADGDGNTTGPDDGYFRIYRTRAVNPLGHGYTMARNQAPPGGALGPTDSVLYSPNCGVTSTVGALTVVATTFRRTAENPAGSNYRNRLMLKQNAFDNAGARCFLGGDPRLNATGVFTPTDSAGDWVLRTSGAVPALVAARPDGAYLWPLSANLNPNFRGAIFVEGRVGVSGTVRGRVTLASRNNMLVLDDLVQATSPATTTGTCRADDDIIGLFSGEGVLFADNQLQSPLRRRNDTNAAWRTPFKDFSPSPAAPDLRFHAVSLALRSVATERPGPATSASTDYINRGTVRQVGGRIQQRAGTMNMSNGVDFHGYVSDISFNRCAMSFPPPYFPTTGRWTLSQYYEIDPQGFNITDWFARR
jgi:hypothetical protein